MGAVGGVHISSLTVTLDFPRHNHGSTVSPVGVGLLVPEVKAVAPGPRGRGLEVNEWGLGEREGRVSQTWRPQTRPKGRGALGIQKPPRPESALPKTCRLGWGGLGKAC